MTTQHQYQSPWAHATSKPTPKRKQTKCLKCGALVDIQTMSKTCPKADHPERKQGHTVSFEFIWNA